MNLIFTEQKKKENILIAVLAIVFLITIFNVWRIFFKTGGTTTVFVTQEISKKEIKVDFSVFDMPVLKALSGDYLNVLEETEKDFGKENLFK
ncbi:MAG: hypothetical protein Q8O39_00610 [bacterium]|nr:hypothetical protein [bacterium]